MPCWMPSCRGCTTGWRWCGGRPHSCCGDGTGRCSRTSRLLVADTTDIVERVENAFKVTEDVYLARIYLAALEIFRGAAWRHGIDRKLAILRDTYGMLNAESQAARGEALELAIVLLIVGEIVLSLVHA